MKALVVTMPDGSKWAVPVDVIARDRAKYYADREFDGDVERSLREDTTPLFDADPYEIEDWAAGNMNWPDVQAHAKKIADREPLTASGLQEGWVNGPKEVLDIPELKAE